MADRKAQVKAAIEENVKDVAEREAADAAAKTAVKKSGAARRRRMRGDAAGRRNEMNAGAQAASLTRTKDVLDTRAMDMINAHAASLAESKRKHPDVQEIQNLEPMSLEEARRQVAAQPVPKPQRVPMVSPTARGTKLTKATSYGDDGTVVPKRRDPRKK